MTYHLSYINTCSSLIIWRKCSMYNKNKWLAEMLDIQYEESDAYTCSIVSVTDLKDAEFIQHFHNTDLKHTLVYVLISGTFGLVSFEVLHRFNNISIIGRLGSRRYPFSETTPRLKSLTLAPQAKSLTTKKLNHHCSSGTFWMKTCPQTVTFPCYQAIPQ